jgi:hypothetical protein
MRAGRASIRDAEHVSSRGGTPSIIIAPSVLSADFARLGETVPQIDLFAITDKHWDDGMAFKLYDVRWPTLRA